MSLEELASRLKITRGAKATIRDLNGRGLIERVDRSVETWVVTDEGKRRLEYVNRLLKTGVVYVNGTARSLPRCAAEISRRSPPVQPSKKRTKRHRRFLLLALTVCVVVFVAALVWAALRLLN